jgi:hypothetical protein
MALWYLLLLVPLALIAWELFHLDDTYPPGH